MAKKRTIGLCFFFTNNTNSGIVNYVYNIISALNTLEAALKPELVVFHSADAPVEFLEKINYPQIRFVLYTPRPASVLLRKANSLVIRLFKTDPYQRYKYLRRTDSLYPYFEFADFGFKGARNKIHWLVDFNNRAFPKHYDEKALDSMNAYQKKITSTPERVVLSSYALLNELKLYYPDYKCEIKIMRFASSLPVLDNTLLPGYLSKHGIDQPYFMSPNQFWEHKNQAVVLDALRILKHQYPQLSCKVLFTGSLVVNRGKGLYADKLREKIEDYGLENYVSFLGVLERTEQLLLMKHSIALLQPSLYEGWSTLVEEAKALNKFIILSDLPVHREQIDVNVDFFDPHDAAKLAEIMAGYLTSPPVSQPVNYADNIRRFGEAALDALTFS